MALSQESNSSVYVKLCVIGDMSIVWCSCVSSNDNKLELSHSHCDLRKLKAFQHENVIISCVAQTCLSKFTFVPSSCSFISSSFQSRRLIIGVASLYYQTSRRKSPPHPHSSSRLLYLQHRISSFSSSPRAKFLKVPLAFSFSIHTFMLSFSSCISSAFIKLLLSRFRSPKSALNTDFSSWSNREIINVQSTRKSME